MRGLAQRALWLALLAACRVAAAQPCITCRSEACPRKGALDEWCGKGQDPLRARPLAPACAPGQAATKRSGGHCCWPGQQWVAGACAGPPLECPAGLVATGSDCRPPVALPAPSCPPGMVRIDDRALPAGSFCLDEVEVTAGDYAACVVRGSCAPAAIAAGCTATAGESDHPVNCVDWFQADTYCRAVGRRLPAGGEWERAVRGPDRTATYPWGDNAPTTELCWDGGGVLARAARQATCPVRGFPAGRTPEGVYDLAGNVAEWVADVDGGARFVRGGSFASFRSGAVQAASSVRIAEPHGYRTPTVGFRCAAAAAGRP